MKKKKVTTFLVKMFPKLIFVVCKFFSIWFLLWLNNLYHILFIQQLMGILFGSTWLLRMLLCRALFFAAHFSFQGYARKTGAELSDDILETAQTLHSASPAVHEIAVFRSGYTSSHSHGNVEGFLSLRPTSSSVFVAFCLVLDSHSVRGETGSRL